MVCRGCGGPAPRKAGTDPRVPPAGMVLVELHDFSPTFKRYNGVATGRPYALRYDGTQFYVLLEDYHADRDRLRLLDAGGADAGNVQADATRD